MEKCGSIRRRCSSGWYLEIISWRFGYGPKYQPETPLSAREL